MRTPSAPTSVPREHGASRRQRGAVALTVALVLIVLLILAGLVIDLGQLFVAKSELQNAMDACALAAARELNTTGTTEANKAVILGRAEATGIAVAARNRMLFQSEAIALQADRDVTFGANLAGPWSTKANAPLDTRFVRCNAQRADIALWFMSLFGVSTEDVVATAAASLQPGNAACFFPVGLCNSAADPLVPGHWYEGKGDVPCLKGACNFVDIAGLTHSANELKDVIAGPGVCGVTLGTSIPAKTGCNESVIDSWNSRFDLFKSKKCTGFPNPVDNPPDFTGYAFTPKNWPAGENAYSAPGGYIDKRDAHALYDGSDGLDPQTMKKFDSCPDIETHAQDRRLVYLPVINCPWDGHVTSVQGSACVLLLTPMTKCTDAVLVEYIGMAGSEACASYGIPGGTGGTGPRVPTLVQ